MEKAYVVQREKHVDLEWVLDFLEEHFFTREALLTDYVLMFKDEINEEERDAMLKDLRRRYEPLVASCCLCLVGRHVRSDARVGLALGRLETRADYFLEKPWDRAAAESPYTCDWLRNVLAAAERRVDFFERYEDVDKVARIVMIGVDKAHEGQRIGSTMLAEMVQWAKQERADLVCGLFTSQRLKRVAERHGFQSYANISLEDFHDSEGRVVYRAAPVVYTVSVMAIKFDKPSSRSG